MLDRRPVVVVDGVPVVRGLELRSVLVLVLLQRGRPTAVPDLVAAVERWGFTFAGRPSKEVADALRWEVRRGRAVRLDRGLYGPGYVAKVTRHRMRRRLADLRRRAKAAAAAAAAVEAAPRGPGGASSRFRVSATTAGDGGEGRPDVIARSVRCLCLGSASQRTTSWVTGRRPATRQVLAVLGRPEGFGALGVSLGRGTGKRGRRSVGRPEPGAGGANAWLVAETRNGSNVRRPSAAGADGWRRRALGTVRACARCSPSSLSSPARPRPVRSSTKRRRSSVVIRCTSTRTPSSS